MKKCSDFIYHIWVMVSLVASFIFMMTLLVLHWMDRINSEITIWLLATSTLALHISIVLTTALKED